MTQRRNVVALAALATMLSASARGQSPKGGSVAAVQTIRGLQDLAPDGAEAIAVVAGYHEPGDGGGGLFVWRPDATAKADGGLVISPSQTDRTGRWRRVHDGPINVRMFGAQGDGKADDTAAIQAAIDAAAGAEVRIPAGTWLITRTLQFRSPAGRHSTGLKLIGDGMGATVLDCRVTDGPALSIGQAQAYNFGKGGLIRDIEFLGRNANPGRDQHGIVLSGAWLYRFERLNIEAFRGNGLMASFVSDRGYRYADVEIAANSNILRRAGGGFRSTVLNGEVIAGDGIAPETFVDAVIDDSTLRMTRAALRDGRSTVNVFGRNPDGQQTVLLAQDCRIIWNRGWGIYGDVGVGFKLTLHDCEVGVNKTGGIRTDGFLDIYGGAVGVNGTDDGKGIGILLDAPTNSGAHRARIEAVEIDGNREVNLWLRRVRFAQVIRCRFNAAEIDAAGQQFPKVSIRLGDGDGSLAKTVSFEQNMIRADGLHMWPHVGFEIPDGAAVDNLVVKDTLFWGGWSDAHHTKYRIGKLANADALLHFDEEGRLANGLPVAAPYIAQLQLSAASGIPVAAGGTLIIAFTSARSNLPKSAMTWPMTSIASLTALAGSADVVIDSPMSHGLSAGMPLLLIGGPLSLDALAGLRIAKVASASELQRLKLDRAEPTSRKVAAVAGGVVSPYDGFFAVDVLADVLATGKAQPVALTVLADGRPWRTENSLIHGLASYETARISFSDRWPAGTTFHVVLSNTSGAPISLQRAMMNVRLLG
jgi:hypothetical protein